MKRKPGALARRIFLLAATALSLTGHAQQPYPSKPVSIVVPYAPGGATDVVARVAANNLATSLKGTFIVENKPGARGTIAMAYVARATPDGHTLLLNEITSTVVPVLFPRLSFDPIKHFTPVSVIAETPYVLVVNAQLPVRDLKGLIAYARSNPGKLNYGSGGAGSGPHIAGELLKSLAKVDITHVPYKGSGPALQDLLGGQIELLVTAAPAVVSYARSGKVRPLVVAGSKRLAILPDVPSADEAGLPEFHISNWFGLATPRGTPDSAIKLLSEGIAEMLNRPDALEKLAAAGAEPVGSGPADSRRRVLSETQRWSALIKKAGITKDN